MAQFHKFNGNSKNRWGEKIQNQKIYHATTRLLSISSPILFPIIIIIIIDAISLEKVP